MKKQNLIVVALLGLVAMAAGCGGGDAAVAYTEDVYCNQRASAECSALASSCAFSTAATDACSANRKARCVTEASILKAPPKRVFREDKAKACVSASRNTFKNSVLAADWLKLQETCSRAFEGQAKDTEACEISLDCISGLICDKGFCGKSRTVEKDAACSNPADRCPTGQFCTKAGAIYKCINRLPVSQACDEPTNLCTESLRCVTGVCQERVKMGEACAADGDCAAGLICDPFILKCSQNVNLGSQCTVLGSGGTPTDASVGG
jgi:hypothetical protein